MAKHDQAGAQAPVETAEVPKTITVDIATLNELISAKVNDQVRERLASMNVIENKSADQKFQDTMDHMRGKNVPLPPEREHACESPATGATFLARVIDSRSFPRGRVVELRDYKEPEGIDVHVSDGGKVPDGLAIRSKDGVFTTEFKMWRYNNFWKKDLAELVGKPFATYYSVEEADRRREIEASRNRAAE